MRPRPDAAENVEPPRRVDRGQRGFNEAAARCRGKLRPLAQVLGGLGPASMRPRPDAAENSLDIAGCRPVSSLQ